MLRALHRSSFSVRPIHRGLRLGTADCTASVARVVVGVVHCSQPVAGHKGARPQPRNARVSNRSCVVGGSQSVAQGTQTSRRAASSELMLLLRPLLLPRSLRLLTVDGSIRKLELSASSCRRLVLVCLLQCQSLSFQLLLRLGLGILGGDRLRNSNSSSVVMAAACGAASNQQQRVRSTVAAFSAATIQLTARTQCWNSFGWPSATGWLRQCSRCQPPAQRTDRRSAEARESCLISSPLPLRLSSLMALLLERLRPFALRCAATT